MLKTLTQFKVTFATQIMKLSLNVGALRQILITFKRRLTGRLTRDISLLTAAYKDINFLGYKHRKLN